MKSRRGHTLTECLIAIGLIASTLTIVAVAMSQMRRSCRHVSQVATAELDLQRFAAQLRADAHQALSVEPETIDPKAADDTPTARGGLLFELADESSVKYTLRATRVERLASRGDEAPWRETYRLPKTFTAAWEVDRERSLPLVSLKLTPGPVGSNVSLGFQPIQINAAVGLLAPLVSSDES